MKHYSSKLLSLVLTFVLLISCVAMASAAEANLPAISGTGTAEDPYQLTTVEQIEYMRAYPDKNFVVMNDISIGRFVPIEKFSGTLNGNGYAFVYPTIQAAETDEYTGFFRTLTVGSSVSNLRLRYLSSVGARNVGSLAGIIAGSVDRIYLEGGCEIHSTSYTYAAGGLCAIAEETASISNIMIQSGTHVAGDIVGGLAGVNKSASYNNVFFLGMVHATQGPYSIAGALFGRHFVMESYVPAVNVYWNATSDGTYGEMQSAAGMIEVTPGVTYTGLEGLVGIKVPTTATTKVPVGKTVQLAVETVPAGVAVNGTWQQSGVNMTLTSDGLATGVYAGTGYGKYVMNFYGTETAVIPFEVTVVAA